MEDDAQRALIEEYDRLLLSTVTPVRQGGEGSMDDSQLTAEEETVVVAPARDLPSADDSAPRAQPPPNPTSFTPGGSSSALQTAGLDSENLSLILDDDCNKLKRDVMEFFVAAKSKLMEREIASVEKERREWTRILHAKQEEIDALSDKFARKDAQNKQMTISLLRAVDFRASTHNKMLEQRTVTLAFSAWRIAVDKNNTLKHKMRNWMAYYSKTYVVGRAFKAWRSSVHHEIHNSLRKKFEAMLELERAHIQAEQADLINSLRLECEELEKKLNKEVEGRQVLEEQMKKAFMRGVCALNLEAMSLMKSGHPPAGLNPFHDPTTGQETIPSQVEPAMAPASLGLGGTAMDALMDAQSSPQPSVENPTRAQEMSASSASAALERFLAQVGGRPR